MRCKPAANGTEMASVGKQDMQAAAARHCMAWTAPAGSGFIWHVLHAGPFKLSNLGEHLCFQRGHLDVFLISNAPDIGTLRQIEVRHDGQGKKNGWHLAWLKVHNDTTGAVAMFNCNRYRRGERRRGRGRNILTEREARERSVGAVGMGVALREAERGERDACQ